MTSLAIQRSQVEETYHRAHRARLLRPFQIDVRALAAMRILLGIAILYDLFDRLRFLKVYFTDWGVSPRGLIAGGIIGKLSFFAVSGSYSWAFTVIAIYILIALAFVLGYQTRFATIALMVMLYSLINRNPTLAHGGHNLELWLLGWSIFLPLAATASVDARLAGFDWRRTRFHRVYTVASAGILWQVAFVYWNAFSVKVSPGWRSEFSAIHYFLQSQFSTPFGFWLTQFAAVTTALTFMTLGLELFGPAIALLVWDMPRTRTVVAAMFILFHLGIVATIYVGTFSAICTAGWILFLPREFWDALQRRSIIRLIVRGWDRVIALPTRAIQSTTTILPLLARRSISAISLGRVTRLALTGLLGYQMLINFLGDIPEGVSRFAGPLRGLPKLKQSWAVMAFPWQYFQRATIELHLANGSTHELTPDDSPDGSFRFTLPRASTPIDYWHRSFWPPETTAMIEYRSTLMLSALYAPTPALVRFCEFHRRLWDEAHPDPGQKVVGLDFYCEYSMIPPPDRANEFPLRVGKWLLHSWPVETEPVKQRVM